MSSAVSQLFDNLWSHDPSEATLDTLEELKLVRASYIHGPLLTTTTTITSNDAATTGLQVKAQEQLKWNNAFQSAVSNLVSSSAESLQTQNVQAFESMSHAYRYISCANQWC